jgi:SNF2 family DNA or RNA helicase
MSSEERAEAINALNKDPAIQVILISLKCGSLGLNLTSANRVVLMDVW